MDDSAVIPKEEAVDADATTLGDLRLPSLEIPDELDMANLWDDQFWIDFPIGLDEKHHQRAKPRLWTDASGQYSVEAILVWADSTKAKLQRIDNNENVEIELSTLSKQDQELCKDFADSLKRHSRRQKLVSDMERGSKVLESAFLSFNDEILALKGESLTTLKLQLAYEEALKKTRQKIAGQRIHLHGTIEDVTSSSAGAKFVELRFNLDRLDTGKIKNSLGNPSTTVGVPMIRASADWLSLEKGTPARIIGTLGEPPAAYHSKMDYEFYVSPLQGNSTSGIGVDIFVQGIHPLTAEEIEVWKFLKRRQALQKEPN